MNKPDVVRLSHMLDAAKDAVTFASGKSRHHLNDDRMLVLSLVKSIEIIGEAASKVSDAGRTDCPEFPWRDIVAMRNRLIHGYFDINYDIVWRTVREELPVLITALESRLSRKVENGE